MQERFGEFPSPGSQLALLATLSPQAGRGKKRRLVGC